MIKQTYWEGKSLWVGNTPDVEDHVAIRWLARGIAEEIEEGEIPPLTPPSTGENPPSDTGQGKEDVKTPPPPVKKSDVNAGKKLGGVIKKHDARVGGEAD
jgi:hypothetical protein